MIGMVSKGKPLEILSVPYVSHYHESRVNSVSMRWPFGISQPNLDGTRDPGFPRPETDPLRTPCGYLIQELDTLELREAHGTCHRRHDVMCNSDCLGDVMTTNAGAPATCVLERARYMFCIILVHSLTSMSY